MIAIEEGDQFEAFATAVFRCHLHYRLEGGSLESHVQTCLAGALETARRVKHDIGEFKPRRILEVGCSVGFNCFALQSVFPDAEIVGIEPDPEAVRRDRRQVLGLERHLLAPGKPLAVAFHSGKSSRALRIFMQAEATVLNWCL